MPDVLKRAAGDGHYRKAIQLLSSSGLAAPLHRNFRDHESQTSTVPTPYYHF